MADAKDLHQIEYRHHQTNDLSPVASSMSSRESLAGWHSRIRAWVRHPHADNLSESACYQAFSNGQAALAWRYWDEQAASREDGTRGRPLVSRVLIGSASVLTFEVALAWCRTGPSEQWLGPLPGHVPDGSLLPVVSGEALTAGAREMISDLDRDSAAQEGLLAVVAAGLDNPSTPLAISVPDTLIQLPLQHCVQCPLLWGLHRITGPLLGSAGRGWSFSTFELALGETDPTSLPAIVFREARDGPKAPPARWRKEAKVRPFDSGALVDGTSYAATIEIAGWLVTEYRERGGEGLEQFIAECADRAGPSALRIEQVWHALRKSHQPADAASQEPDAPKPESGEPESGEPAAAESEAVQYGDDKLPGDPANFATEDKPPCPNASATVSPDNSDLVPSDGDRGNDAPFEEGPMRSPYGGDQAPGDASQAPMSSLLKQLELLGEDQERFLSVLEDIGQTGNATPEEREKSWYVISGAGWYENVSRNDSFRPGNLASILALVVIPELAGQLRGETIAGWAEQAPVPMVVGLLAAAQADSEEMWETAAGILEPVLAYRWMKEQFAGDYWPGARAVHPYVTPGQVDNRGGLRARLRKQGGRHRG
jgi:hypothetical protein